jgi:hypothetical protein
MVETAAMRQFRPPSGLGAGHPDRPWRRVPAGLQSRLCRSQRRASAHPDPKRLDHGFVEQLQGRFRRTYYSKHGDHHRLPRFYTTLIGVPRAFRNLDQKICHERLALTFEGAPLCDSYPRP